MILALHNRASLLMRRIRNISHFVLLLKSEYWENTIRQLKDMNLFHQGIGLALIGGSIEEFFLYPDVLGTHILYKLSFTLCLVYVI